MNIQKQIFHGLIGLSVSILIGSASASAEPMTGAQLARQCAQCHDTNGNGGFANLTSKSANALYKQLLNMKGRATPQGIMDLQAKGYTDEQLWLISEYFGSQSSTKTTGKPQK